jgi:hypothetical protein
MTSPLLNKPEIRGEKPPLPSKIGTDLSEMRAVDAKDKPSSKAKDGEKAID